MWFVLDGQHTRVYAEVAERAVARGLGPAGAGDGGGVRGVLPGQDHTQPVAAATAPHGGLGRLAQQDLR